MAIRIMTKTVRITYAGDTVTMTCDMSDASAPIVVDGNATQYQTADARHRTHLAVALAASVAWPGVEWPAVTGDHPIEDDATEAWADLEYETVRKVTDAQIRALRTESAEAGDLAQVAICDRALLGDHEARAACADTIAEARAASVTRAYR